MSQLVRRGGCGAGLRAHALTCNVGDMDTATTDTVTYYCDRSQSVRRVRFYVQGHTVEQDTHYPHEHDARNGVPLTAFTFGVWTILAVSWSDANAIRNYL